MKHYKLISTFYKKNSHSSIAGIDVSSLVDLIYSDKNKKFIIYDDTLYSRISDSLLINWDDDKALVIAPNDYSELTAPTGFNRYNQHSLQYFTKIYSSLYDEIQTILCAASQAQAIINKGNYKNFIINQNTEYDQCLAFCKKHYENVDTVSGMGQYSRRGGVVDIYPDISSSPKRIVFLGDETEIYNFDLEMQARLNKISELKIPIKMNSVSIAESINEKNKDWIQFNLTESCLLININTNISNIVFPFQKVEYVQYKKTCSQYDVIYENVNRLYGFLSDNKMIVPSWFKSQKKIVKNPVIEMTDINVGDYVVHRDYGIGQFVGLKIIEASESIDTQELLMIKYQDNSHLSVDINHIDKVTYYADKDHNIITDSLTKTGHWKRRRRLAEKNVQNIVNKLLNTYINREKAYREIIHSSADEKSFINDFQYLETPGQIQAWEDISSDLENNSPMDRLVCGDVGFGKTEIAMRAAYRYANNNKKIIVLAPTTILAQQLYESFVDRMEGFGVIIDSVSRLKSKKDLNQIKDKWVSNQIDILVGTHAILYNNIYLEHCDLLIIDEEHRFGVKQKDTIKDIKPNIDILTMSATPIPRTLNMALSGMKKISTLTTPPKYRKPIKTTIGYYNEKLIINVINSEIFRNGQVYFVHNNVNTLDGIVGFLDAKLPHLTISSIHGQMDSKIIQKRMEKFTKKEINVLVCTSIIENGIDISNVNTIIINNAHKFGLSQLYQIRGRVGRAAQQAYAFLLIPNKFKLNQDAYARLKAIEDYTHLGSGYKIANMDLTIRGGGSIFGYDQSGNIDSIGYELVSRLINEHMHSQNHFKTHVNFIDKGVIPEQYLYSEKLRLLMYRKIKSIRHDNELSIIEDEIIDRFGPMPSEIMRIINIQKIAIKCQNLYISLLEEKKEHIIVQFQSSFWEKKISKLLKKINEFINKHEINYQIEEFKESLILKLFKKGDAVSLMNKFIKVLK